MENKLEIIVKESGLEQTKAKFILEQFKDYFEIADEWEKKSKAIIVNDESQTVDMEMARVGRKFLSQKRFDIEKSRKLLKSQSLMEGKAIDGIANVLKALIVPIEEHLKKQEKFIEIKKEEKEKALRIEIEERIEEERIKEEERVEKERREKEKADAEERARVQEENRKLIKEAEEKEKLLMKERKKAEEERLAKEEEVKREADRLHKLSEERLRKLEQESEAKLEEAREEKRKADAEIQAKIDEEERIREEEGAKEKALLNASDSVKFNEFARKLFLVPFPRAKNKENELKLKKVEELMKQIFEILEIVINKGS